MALLEALQESESVPLLRSTAAGLAQRARLGRAAPATGPLPGRL